MTFGFFRRNVLRRGPGLFRRGPGLFRRVFFRQRQASPEWFVSFLASFLASLATLIAVWDSGDRAADQLKTLFTVRNGFEEFDFIVGKLSFNFI